MGSFQGLDEGGWGARREFQFERMKDSADEWL